jgi:aminopeptidase N
MSRFALLALLVALPAHATLDITRQDLSVDLATSATAVDITSTLSFSVNASAASVDLLAPSVAVDAASIDGAPAAFSVTGYLLRVTPAVPLDVGNHTLEVHYSGVPQCMSSGRRECSRTMALTFLPSLSQTLRWYLLAYTGSDSFVGTVRIRDTATHQVALVQGGTGSKTELGDGTARWSFDYVTPTEHLGLVSGQLSSVQSADGFVTGYLATPSTAPVMQRFVDDAARYYPVFTELYGPLPLAHFNVTFVPQDFVAGAMGLFGLVFANEVLSYPSLDYIVPAFPHEVAHSWWGNYAQPDTAFLSESMAEYSLWRAAGILDGEAVGAAGRRLNAVWYLYGRGNGGDAAILDPGVYSSPVYIHVTYHKGSVVVRTLEEAVGTAAFTRGLKNAVQGHRYLSVDDWLGEIQAQTPLDLKPWRKAWLETAGFPKLAVASAVGGDGHVQLRVTMAGDFPLQAPLRFSFSDGTVEKRSVLLKGGATDFTETFASPPVSIAIDPEWTAVREVQPEVQGDVNLDGQVDGADLLEVAAHLGGAVPAARRMDGHFDPLFDLDHDLTVGPGDVALVLLRAQ